LDFHPSLQVADRDVIQWFIYIAGERARVFVDRMPLE
jgi:hypothetical protein